VLRFEVSRSVITVQREFHARFKKDAPHKNNVFFKPCRVYPSSTQARAHTHTHTHTHARVALNETVSAV
jgi:hypothetical protein